MKATTRVIILAVIILIILVAALFIPSLAPKGTKEIPQAPKVECFRDEDCIKVQLTCCPCNMGGTEACVPRILEEAYKEKLKNCPKDQFCIALYNCKITACSCVEGKCVAK